MRPHHLVTPVLLSLLVACPGRTKPTAGIGKGTGDPTITDPGLEPTLPLWSAVRTGTLKNGLTYYVLPHPKPDDRAYLWLAVNAGSVQEDDDQQGLAHFVEHMAFNGTTHFAHQEIVSYIESIGMDFGADLNAGTWPDKTVYQLLVPTDDAKIVGKGLDILRDWASEISFDPAEVELERGVVLEEWRLRRSGYARVYEQQSKVLYHDSRYAERDPIGKPDIIKGATRETLVRYYEDWYRPDLMAVIVVGDIDADTIEAEIEKRFDDLEAPAKPRARPDAGVPPASGMRISILTDPEIPSATLQVKNTFPHRRESTKSDYRRFMLDAIYHRMLNDRFDELSQRAESPFTFAFSTTGDETREIDAFTRYAAVKDGQLDAAIGALFTEVLRVEQHGFTATELERAKKAQLRAMHQAARDIALGDGRELVDELTRTFLEAELNIGRVEEAKLGDELIPTITLEEVAALAASWGGEENRVVLINGPSSMTVPTEAHVKKLIAAVSDQELEPWIDDAAGPLIAKAPTAGTITAEQELVEGGMEWTLSNGARVVVMPTTHEADTVLFQGFSPGGTGQASDKIFPSARFATDVVTGGGAGTHSSVQLDKLLSGTVANLGMWIGETEEGLYGQASAQDLEVLLQQAWLRMTSPRKDEQAFAAWKQGTMEWAKHRRVDPENVFYEDMATVMDGGHARRKPPEEKDIEKVDLDQAIAFYQDRFGDAGDFTFIFVGNLDAKVLRPLVETYIASLPGTSRKETGKDPGIKRPKKVTKKVIRRGQEPKSSVYLTFHADQKWSRDADIDIDILGDVLGLTLHDILREQMSGVYGVGVWGWISRHPHQERAFTVQFGCAPENVEKLEQAVFTEIARIQKDGVGEDLLDKVRETRRRGRQEALRDNRAWSGWLAESYRYGDDLGTVMDLDAVLKRITNDNLKAAAKKYLDKKQYVLGELYPETGEGSKPAEEPKSKKPKAKVKAKAGAAMNPR